MRMGVFLLASFLGTAFFSLAVYGQTKVNVAYTGESPTQLAAYLAKETGIFTRNGLDVQVIRTNSSIAVMALP